jgi:predicted dehydrogenase
MKHRFAFAGFGHGHIDSLYGLVRDSPDIELAGACEPDEGLRAVAENNGIEFTHPSYEQMLDAVDCDVVAIGAYFGARGAIAIDALRRGKHVIADKPLCIHLDELEQIEALAAANDLRVGCMLGMRSTPAVAGVRQLIQRGDLGNIHAITFGGQHPLNIDIRPGWYFEEGKHGGTINDLFIHAADSIPWATGLSLATVEAARCWNALAPQYPHFEDGAQMMLTMSNGCGVIGDVSYFMPSKGGYRLPYYWRTTFFGSEGIAEISAVRDLIDVTRNGAVVSIEPEAPEPEGYLASFLGDIAGTASVESMVTADVFHATRVALMVQKAADQGEHGVSLTQRP